MKSNKNKKFKKKLKLQKRDKTVEKNRISIKKKYRMILLIYQRTSNTEYYTG